MCLSFSCLRNSLIGLNIFYVVIGIVLIYSSISGKISSPYSHNLPVATGIEICGTFLIGLAVLGIVGAVKHHQVILFFYMIILFALFLTQVMISYASIAVSNKQLDNFATKSWTSMDLENRKKFMTEYHCCDFEMAISTNEITSVGKSCPNICCNVTDGSKCDCPKCFDQLVNIIGYVFNLAGRLGMIFSFTEIFGVWLTKRYRNQKDPRAHPSAFL